MKINLICIKKSDIAIQIQLAPVALNYSPFKWNLDTYQVFSPGGLYRNPCVSVCVSICFLFVLCFQNSQRNLYWGKPGASYWSAVQYKQLVRCTTSVQCTGAGINSRITVPSKVCALRCPKCAWGSRTPARFVVLVILHLKTVQKETQIEKCSSPKLTWPDQKHWDIV